MTNEKVNIVGIYLNIVSIKENIINELNKSKKITLTIGYYDPEIFFFNNKKEYIQHFDNILNNFIETNFNYFVIDDKIYKLKNYDIIKKNKYIWWNDCSI
jgi:hypothetical protein